MILLIVFSIAIIVPGVYVALCWFNKLNEPLCRGFIPAIVFLGCVLGVLAGYVVPYVLDIGLYLVGHDESYSPGYCEGAVHMWVCAAGPLAGAYCAYRAGVGHQVKLGLREAGSDSHCMAGYSLGARIGIGAAMLVSAIIAVVLGYLSALFLCQHCFTMGSSNPSGFFIAFIGYIAAPAVAAYAVYRLFGWLGRCRATGSEIEVLHVFKVVGMCIAVVLGTLFGCWVASIFANPILAQSVSLFRYSNVCAVFFLLVFGPAVGGFAVYRLGKWLETRRQSRL